MPYNNATLLDVFTAGTNFGNHVMDRAEKWNLEKAQIELTAMKNQFNTDVNNELMKLQKSNNWENWDSQINDFMEKTVSRTGDSNSPYYCRNPYMAQAATQMFEAEKVQLNQKVQQMKWQKESEHMINLYNKNREADRTNMLLTAQQRYDQGRAEAKAMYEGGVLSETQYNQENNRLFQQAYSDDVISKVSSAFDEAIANNMSFENLWQVYKKSNPETMKRYGMEGMEEATDFSGLDASLKKSLKEDYTARVKDMQQKNADYLSTVYQRLEAAETETDKLQIRREGQRYLGQLKGMQLDEQSRNEYAYKFRIEAQKTAGTVTNSGNGTGSKNGNGKGVGSGDSDGVIKAKTYDRTLDDLRKSFIEGVLRGDYTLEDGQAYIKTNIDDLAKTGWISDLNTEDQDVIDKYHDLHGGWLTEQQLYIDLLKRMEDDPQFIAVKPYIDQYTKDWLKNPDQYGDCTPGWLAQNIIDLAANGGMKNMPEKEVIEYMNKIQSQTFGTQISNISKGIGVSNTGTLNFKNNKQKNEYLAKAIDIATNNDAMFIDNQGREHWSSKEAQKQGEQLAKELQYDLADTLRIDPSKLIMTYQVDENGNEIPLPTFQVVGGTHTYTPRVIKDRKGNITGYEYYDNVTRKAMVPAEYTKADPNAAAKQQQQAARSDTQAAQKNTNELNKSRQVKLEEAMNADQQPDRVRSFSGQSDESWKGSNRRGDITDKAVTSANTEIAKYKNMSPGIEKTQAAQLLANKLKVSVSELDKLLLQWDKSDTKARINYLVVGSFY